MKFPIFNSTFDDQKDEIIIKKYINLGIAVDTDDGLIVPNIK
ncbi:MAG: 2-oxo acid dehydrogenase subunit E2, partial [Sweet potato little leaf phytoplasma]|nr:2-oxo acid dehydrogenase subunit E2 [Sweet potato little leaf phytoplasma]